MIRAVRRLVGMALGVAGVIAPAWGMFHLVRTPACGSDGVGVYGPPCADEVGLWIAAVVVAATVVLPLAIGIAGWGEPGRLLLLGPVLAMGPLCVAGAVVWSLTGASSDPDSRWVGYLIGGLVALLLLWALVGRVRRGGRPSPRSPAPAPVSVPAAPAPGAAQLSTLAAQLSQVAAAKAAVADDGLAARLQRLDELRSAGAITADEHARRRREILDEV